MSLITEISNWTTKVLGNIIDDKTNKLYSSLLTNDFIREFGSEVENVSQLAEMLSLSPTEEARQVAVHDDVWLWGEDGAIIAIDNFFDFFLNLSEQNLVQTVLQGQVIIDGAMLPIAVQNIDVDNKIQDPKDLGVKSGQAVKDSLLTPQKVIDGLGLPLGYEPSTIVIDAIIPNGANTSPNLKMGLLWRLHKTSNLFTKESLKPIKLTKFKKNEFAATHTIWNPFINSCGIKLVTMRGLAPSRSSNHDGIVVKITMREDILSQFFDQDADQSSKNNPPERSKQGEEFRGKIKAVAVDILSLRSLINNL